MYFTRLMAEEFILVVDDFSWQQVKRGTYDGIKEANLQILFEQVIWDGKHHRIDGPAIEHYGGDKYYWDNGVFICKTQEQFDEYLMQKVLK